MVLRYVCEGSCKGSVSKEDYTEGQTCATENCEKHGQPLIKKEVEE